MDTAEKLIALKVGGTLLSISAVAGLVYLGAKKLERPFYHALGTTEQVKETVNEQIQELNNTTSTFRTCEKTGEIFPVYWEWRKTAPYIYRIPSLFSIGEYNRQFTKFKLNCAVKEEKKTSIIDTILQTIGAGGGTANEQSTRRELIP